MAKKKAKAIYKKPQVPFASKLVLNQWVLSLFNVQRFEELAEHLHDEAQEGLDENNIHRFHHALTTHHSDLTQLPVELLLEYDQNIVTHTQRLNERRITRGDEPIVWKYFQYLTLLFSEIYLDRYFCDPKALLVELNVQVATYNTDTPKADQIAAFDEAAEAWSQLNKLAFWMATGSGKTLLMHANILQYQHALTQHGRRRELNRILLLTPNEGLSQQHLREFEAAGIAAALFNKDGGRLIDGQAVEIIEVTRLRDEMGNRTIAIDAFEGNNLVLVDEGHRGTSGGEEGAWMRFRNALCEKGFSFEYSATFGQAVKGKPQLVELYGKSTLCDYSYRYFYGDGFGKDYQILNLDQGTQQNHLELYLVACLLSFFQQQRLYCDQGGALRPFKIKNPLWIFVGGSVTATLAQKDASDIVEILQFLARYVADHAGSIQRIDRVLNQGLVTATGKNLFAGRFAYLNTCGLSSAQIYDETLETLFNAPGGGLLYIENLKGATGEVALRVGAENKPFGVINVGDDAKLVKRCEENGLAAGDCEFSGSLFHKINQPNSTVHLLIGSKKFTEGWSSWRVSTMGLMNVGKGEGAQIIQLFGRGVRLKGYDLSLKRSGKTKLPEGLERPTHIGVLETLGIFGIHADYMAQFRDFLDEEGLPTNDDRIEFLLPVIKNLGTQKLKTIRIKRTINGISTEFGDAFKTLGPIPTLRKPDPGTEPATRYLQENQVVLNWYPKIQSLKSTGLDGGDQESTPQHSYLSARHVAFLDLDALFFELHRFTVERAWHNFNLSREVITDLLQDQSWYKLLIPEEELAFDSFERIRLWQEIATALLKKYCKRYYAFRKNEWELPHLEYRAIDGSDPNFPSGDDEYPDGYYRILIQESQTEIIDKLKALKILIETGGLKHWQFDGLRAIWFGQHLYNPLLHLAGSAVAIMPVPLNAGERRFVEDLKTYFDKSPALLKDSELYLLRNMSKGRGIGFFEVGNFHPDFIIWLLARDRQYISFVDPKGIRNLGLTDPKIKFFKTIKKIETRLADPAVTLNSFIISNTFMHDMKHQWAVDKAYMEARHIFFQDEDKDTYIEALLSKVLVA